MTFKEMWADLKSKYPKIYITAEQLSDAMKDLDAVCVVRCKDCKYFEEIMTARYRDGTTKEVQICKKHVPLKGEYFYCGWGEQKDEVESNTETLEMWNLDGSPTRYIKGKRMDEVEE